MFTQSSIVNAKYVLRMPADSSKANKQAREAAYNLLSLWVAFLKNKYGTLTCADELQECYPLLDNFDNQL